MDEFIQQNRRNYDAYRDGLKNIPGCHQLTYDETESNNYQYIVLEIDEAKFGMPRDTLVTLLHAENVRARRYFYPGVHRMAPYRNYYPNAGLLLPETESLVNRTLCLPTGSSVETLQIQQICSLIAFASENAGTILKAS